MRDEKKAALVFTGIVSALVVGTKFCNRPVWTSLVTHAPTSVVEKPVPPKVELPSPSGFKDFLQVYGDPSLEGKNDRQSPHSPLAIKWLDYEPEHVRVAFVAADSGGDRPRREWIAFAYIDSAANRPISAADAAQLLNARRK